MSEVYKAISAVAADLCGVGVGKDGYNQAQGFKYRSIEAAVAATAPLLVKHGLLILPFVTGVKQVGRDGTNKQGASKFTMHTTIDVTYEFVSVKDDIHHSCSIPGEAADTGDKGVAKALSMAYKYLVFQAFCVPIAGQEDADSETHVFQTATATAKVTEAKPDSPAESAAESRPAISEAQRQTLIPLLNEAKVEVKAFLDHYKVIALSALPASEFDSVYATLNKRVGEARADRVLAGDAPAATHKAAEPKPAAARPSEPAGDSPAGSAEQPKKAALGPKVSRFRGVR